MAKLSSYSDKIAIREVLGCLMLKPDLLKKYKLVKTDFPETLHKIIFASIYNLINSGAKEIDLVAIDSYLRQFPTQYNTFKKSGVEYLEGAMELASLSNFDYYYKKLRKFTLLRSYKENGTDVSEFFNPLEIDPDRVEELREKLNNATPQDIIKHFRRKQLAVEVNFDRTNGRESKKAGVGGKEQKEKWKAQTAWGLGYASAYLTTALHGLRKQRFTVKSAGSGVGILLF